MFDVANMFVSEALKSNHAFPSQDLLQASLIENYPALNVGYAPLSSIVTPPAPKCVCSYGVVEYYFY